MRLTKQQVLEYMQSDDYNSKYFGGESKVTSLNSFKPIYIKDYDGVWRDKITADYYIESSLEEGKIINYISSFAYEDIGNYFAKIREERFKKILGL